MPFCIKCGAKMDDDDLFCRKCGAKLKDLDEDLIESETKENKSDGDAEKSEGAKSKTDLNNSGSDSNISDDSLKDDFKPNIKYSHNKDKNILDENGNKLILLPIILGIIGIVLGILEGLNCPMLMGWENILFEMIVAIMGGCLGLILFKIFDEYLLAGVEFIITGSLMYLALYNLALIGSILFIIAGVFSIVLFKRGINDKKLISIPILTIVVPFLILIMIMAVSAVAESNLTNQVNISNVENSIVSDYGYYSGSLKGDIYLNADFEYIELDIEYFDADGKVLDSNYAWNQANAQSGKTYQFESSYYNKEQPVKAQITIYKDSIDKKPFYIQNVTLT